VRKRDWLLVAIDNRIEPIQIQKTLFKFAMESQAPEGEKYQFMPYNWGPCSFEIYDDLAVMRNEGLIEFIPTGQGWNLYHLTEAGSNLRTKLRKEASPIILEMLDKARNFVITRDFRTLLSDIYKEYPVYAVESMFRD